MNTESFKSLIKKLPSGEKFTNEKLREIYESENEAPSDPRACGAVYRSLQSENIIKCVEIRKSVRASRHGGYNTLWVRV